MVSAEDAMAVNRSVYGQGDGWMDGWLQEAEVGKEKFSASVDRGEGRAAGRVLGVRSWTVCFWLRPFRELEICLKGRDSDVPLLVG
jgi:hypothetical protein